MTQGLIPKEDCSSEQTSKPTDTLANQSLEHYSAIQAFPGLSLGQRLQLGILRDEKGRKGELARRRRKTEGFGMESGQGAPDFFLLHLEKMI